MTAQDEFDVVVTRATDDAAAVIRRHALDLQAKTGMDPTCTYHYVLMRLRDSDNGMTVDGRAGLWRVRCRIYTQDDGFKEPLADSDPQKPPGASGDTLLISLPAVVEWVRELAREYHGNAVMTGLDKHSTTSRLKSFRTQLSARKDGTGTLQLTYQIAGGHRFRPGTTTMHARVDIEREARSPSSEISHQNALFQKGT